MSKCASKAWLTLIVAVVLAAAFFYWANRALPTRGAEGREFSSDWPAALLMPSTLRVATYNIDGGVGLDDRYDLNRIADNIRPYDLIGMEEVHGFLFGPPANQAQVLGENLRRPWLYAPSEHRWFHDSFGNAVISSVRVRRWLRIPLVGTQNRGQRNVVLLNIYVAGMPVNVLVTHLDREADRSAQLQSISMLFFSLAEPVVLMGDLNREPDDPELQPLIHAVGVEDCLARFPSKFNQTRVDWILTRGMTALSAGLDEGGDASDHPLAWAELAIKRQSRRATAQNGATTRAAVPPAMSPVMSPATEPS
jgi:endonuclease/exonuclease/phosphatase family metal-dependent hydrolase